MVSWCCLAQTREGAPKPPKPRVPVRAYLKRLARLAREDHNWRRFVFSQCAISTATMAGIFVPVWGKFDLVLSDYEIGLMTSCAAAGDMLGNPLFGFLGDRRGHKRCLELAAAAHVVAMAAVLLFPHRLGLYGALVMIGLYNAGRRVSGTVIAFEFCVPDDRPTYVGLTSTALGPFFAFGGIGCGLLVIAFGYQTVFVVSLLLTACGALYLARAVREPRLLVGLRTQEYP
jgi:predicted MFS family arabinose efflux permease